MTDETENRDALGRRDYPAITDADIAADKAEDWWRKAPEHLQPTLRVLASRVDDYWASGLEISPRAWSRVSRAAGDMLWIDLVQHNRTTLQQALEGCGKRTITVLVEAMPRIRNLKGDDEKVPLSLGMDISPYLPYLRKGGILKKD